LSPVVGCGSVAQLVFCVSVWSGLPPAVFAVLVLSSLVVFAACAGSVLSCSGAFGVFASGLGWTVTLRYLWCIAFFARAVWMFWFHFCGRFIWSIWLLFVVRVLSRCICGSLLFARVLVALLHVGGFGLPHFFRDVTEHGFAGVGVLRRLAAGCPCWSVSSLWCCLLVLLCCLRGIMRISCCWRRSSGLGSSYVYGRSLYLERCGLEARWAVGHWFGGFAFGYAAGGAVRSSGIFAVNLRFC